nr:immunoglobulin heavy chain junction region [Macaca mulatta]
CSLYSSSSNAFDFW